MQCAVLGGDLEQKVSSGPGPSKVAALLELGLCRELDLAEETPWPLWARHNDPISDLEGGAGTGEKMT